MNYNTYIIAEIGINHEGSFTLCKDMVYAAKKAGVNAIKLQTIDPSKCYARDTESFKLFSKANLTKKETEKIFHYAKSLKLDVFTTVGDIQTANWIKKLKPSAWKISASLLTHIPLLEHIASFQEPIYLSTGLSTNKEIDYAVGILKKKKKRNYSLLHCVSKYPTPPSEAHLSRIDYLKKNYSVDIGYSDHTLGHLASCIAVSRGASIIEKHFTKSNKKKGYDHQISLDYKGMKELVENIKSTEFMLNNNIKFLDVVRKNRKKFLRVLVANCRIKKGEKFSAINVSAKRVNNSNNSVSPIYFKKLIGKSSLKNYEVDQLIISKELKS